MIIIPALLEKRDLFKIGSTGCLYICMDIFDGIVFYTGQNNQVSKLTRESYPYFSRMSVKSKLKLTLIKDGDFHCPPEELHKHILIVPENSLA